MGIAASPAAQAAMNARHAQPESCICGPLHEGPAEPRVVFYKLTHRFVDSEKNISQDSSDIIYYALAVGHNTGLCDCLDEELACSEAKYRQLVDLFPEGAARYKMEGILRCDEIVVDRTHVKVLDQPVHALAAECVSNPERAAEAAWLAHFAQMIDRIKADPAIYYMGRMRR